jgi:superfamily II DNA/RNA helicase
LSDDGKDLDCDYNEDDGVIDFDRPRLIWNEYQPFTNRTATLYNHDLSKVYERSLAADIVYKDYTAGDNTYCYLSTIAQQDDLRQALIIKGIPESDICIVNSKMDTKAKELLFSDIKVQSAKYRVMITTSCISIGVDIDTDHYKKTLAVYSHNTASA